MTSLARRPFGDTGLMVSPLGYGAGNIGSPDLDEHTVGHLLNAVVDAGINLIDTARSYGMSEERVGRHLSWRRDEVLLSTKVGYGVEGVPDWTPNCIERGVDEAMRRLRTDHIDIVHLHSCPTDILRSSGVVEALARAVETGKVRVAAYSGENEALEYALSTGVFGSVQTSVNVCDRHSLHDILPRHPRSGVIAKRAMANAPWRFAQRPEGQYVETYWTRLQALVIDPGELEWPELFLRFAAFQPQVHTCIVATTDLRHLEQNLDFVSRGPLPDALREHVTSAYRDTGEGWPGDI